MDFVLGCVLSNVQEYGFRNAGQQVGAYSCTPLQLAEQFRLRFRYLGPLSLLTRLAESFCRGFLFNLAFRTDTFQKYAGGFVLRVLGYEFALEGALEDRLTQPLSTLQVGSNDSFEFVDDREAALDLSDNTVLFSQGRNRNSKCLQQSFRQAQRYLCD